MGLVACAPAPAATTSDAAFAPALLAIQRAGNRNAANAFVERWTTWRPNLHEAIAQRMRDSERTRFTIVTYEALDGAR